MNNNISKFARILCPLDGSKNGEAALPYVESLPITTNAEVVLIQVITPHHYDIELGEHYTSHVGRLTEEYVLHASASAREYLDTIKERLAKLKIVVSCEVEVGSPAKIIVSYAEENDINLIAISTHGRSGISRWLMGSVADKVLHATDIPILLVRAFTKSTKEQL